MGTVAKAQTGTNFVEKLIVVEIGIKTPKV
jgi:hypothetical protein